MSKFEVQGMTAYEVELRVGREDDGMLYIYGDENDAPLFYLDTEAGKRLLHRLTTALWANLGTEHMTKQLAVLAEILTMSDEVENAETPDEVKALAEAFKAKVADNKAVEEEE